MCPHNSYVLISVLSFHLRPRMRYFPKLITTLHEIHYTYVLVSPLYVFLNCHYYMSCFILAQEAKDLLAKVGNIEYFIHKKKRKIWRVPWRDKMNIYSLIHSITPHPSTSKFNILNCNINKTGFCCFYSKQVRKQRL